MVWRLGLLVLWQLSLGCTSEVVPDKEVTRSEKALMHLAVANGALTQNDYTGALQALIQAEKLDPSIPSIYHSKAIAYLGKHDQAKAIAAAQRAVEISPHFSEANNTLGSILIESGRSEEAIPYLMAAAQDSLFRDAYKAWSNLGILRYRQGQMNQARVYFDRAVLEAPKQACGAYFYRGQIFEKNHELDKAIENYQMATKHFCAHFAEAALALGLAYEMKRDYSQARKTFLEIHQRYPNTRVEEQAMNQLRSLP